MSAPAIRFFDVSYQYPDGTLALDRVSFAIQPGEKVGIVGPNGAGKSTLLLHLNGVLLAKTGAVSINGIEVGKKTLREVRRAVGVVFQNPDDQLFSTTVAEDVAFGPRNMGLPAAEVDRRVKDALELVGLTGFERRSAHHLSYGQKKKVAIATVLSMMPPIWAFDEPSANLDSPSQAAVEQFIASRPDTVLVVTQDLSFAAETCSRLIVLVEGRLVFDGAVEELFARSELMTQWHLDMERRCRACERIRRGRSRTEAK